MVSVVVFDLDDTLYPEADFVQSGLTTVGEWCEKELGIRGFADIAWRLFRGGRRGDIFDAAFSHLEISPARETISRMVAVYRGHLPQIALPSDSVWCIQQLRERWKLGLITDGPSEMQWNKIRALQLEPLFDAIIVTADLGEGLSKPHPRAFTDMEERLCATGAGLLYIADNPAKDFVAPRERQWRTIRIVRPEGLYRGMPVAVAAEFSVADLSSIPRIVADL
jgi:putative hydrolase of the HAD superfamily